MLPASSLFEDQSITFFYEDGKKSISTAGLYEKTSHKTMWAKTFQLMAADWLVFDHLVSYHIDNHYLKSDFTDIINVKMFRKNRKNSTFYTA